MFVVAPASKATIVIFSTSLARRDGVAGAGERALAGRDRGPRVAHFGARLDLHLLQRQRRRLEDRLALAAQAAALPAIEQRLRQLQRQRPRARRLEQSRTASAAAARSSPTPPATNPCGCR